MTKVWVNGRSVARYIDPDPPAGPLAEDCGLALTGGAGAGRPGRFEVGHVTLRRLPVGWGGPAPDPTFFMGKALTGWTRVRGQ